MAISKILMHSIKANFDRILGVLREVAESEEITSEGNFLRPGPKPRFSDMEVIALSLTAEALGIDSENLLFAKIECDYAKDFPQMISRRQYNDRRKQMFQWQEVLRLRLAKKLNEVNEVYAIDSMPVEVCKLARAERCKLGKEQECSVPPNKGYCAAQDKYYFGYKLNCVCSPNGVIGPFDMMQASVHDIQYLSDVRATLSNCILVGDKGYVNKALQEEIKQEHGISLVVPPKKKQGEEKAKKMPYVFRKIRKRMETVFSQLCDQFMIQRNYAKTFYGFKTRILAKVASMTILQYLNKFVNGRPVGQIKYALR